MSRAATASGYRRAVTDPDTSLELGRTLRELRLARGLTQSDVAGADFTKALVSQIELGRTRPSAYSLELIARRLGTSADEVLAAVPRRRPGPVAPGDDSRVTLRRAEALLATGKVDEADEQLSACRATELSLDLLSTALRLQAEITLGRGDHSKAAREATEAMAVAERARSSAESVLAANVAGRAHFHGGRFAGALQYFEIAVARMNVAGRVDARLMSRMLVNRGNAHWRLGDTDSAQADFQSALRHAEAAEDLQELAFVHMGLGEMAREGGDLVVAVHHTKLAISLFERIEERVFLVQNLHNLGEMTAAMGDTATARSLYERTLEAGRAIRDLRIVGYALERLAVLDVEAGASASALPRVKEAIDLATESGDNLLLSQCHATHADILEARGNTRAADRAYRKAIDVARADGPYSARRVLLRHGAVLRERGDLGAAATSFEQAAQLGARGA
jgi:tetratricopeptide (TPR) repeat protein